MIFQKGHIDMIRNGLYHLPTDALNIPIEMRQIKTQTRRVNRGIYQVGRDYAVQRKRGAKAEEDIRIVMDNIWREQCGGPWGEEYLILPSNAQAEGGYRVGKFETVFREAYPKWDGMYRWAFEFHVIEVQK